MGEIESNSLDDILVLLLNYSILRQNCKMSSSVQYKFYFFSLSESSFRCDLSRCCKHYSTCINKNNISSEVS